MNEKYKFPKNSFPIGGWVAPPPRGVISSESFITEKNYKKVSNCGINFVCCIYEGYPKETDEVINALTFAEKANIGCLICDLNIRDDNNFDKNLWINGIKDYKNFKSFYGLIVKDEPGLIHFELLAKKFEIIKNYLPEKLRYVNMLPTYAPNAMLKKGYCEGEDEYVLQSTKEQYIQYLDSFIKFVKPQILSYDYYGILSNGNIKKDYFLQLEIANMLSKKYDIPFWPMIQACSFNKNSKDVSYNELIWQVNTCLCYGAKGIQYFVLWSPKDNKYEHYEGCIFEQDGSTKERYTQIKKINNHIQKVGKILLNAEHIGVISFGTSPAELLMQENICDIIDKVVGNILIGIFKNKEKFILYIVLNCLNGSEKIKIKLNKNYCVVNENSFDCNDNSFVKELDAGEGILILINKVK